MNDSNNIVAANDKSDSHNSNGNGGQKTYFWSDVGGTAFEKDLSDAYEKIVYWNRNLFMVLSGATGKKYIEEITRLLKLGIQDSPLKSIALKATRHASIVASETQKIFEVKGPFSIT